MSGGIVSKVRDLTSETAPDRGNNCIVGSLIERMHKLLELPKRSPYWSESEEGEDDLINTRPPAPASMDEVFAQLLIHGGRKG